MASSVRAAAKRYVVDRRGVKEGVILPLAEYRQLLEDLHDLAVVAERREESPSTLKEMRRRLRQHGVI